MAYGIWEIAYCVWCIGYDEGGEMGFRFEELAIFQGAVEFAVSIYKAVKEFPDTEKNFQKVVINPLCAL